MQNTSREISANGTCVKASDVEEKLDDGNIEEAESFLKEGLSVNQEVLSQFLCLGIILSS